MQTTWEKIQEYWALGMYREAAREVVIFMFAVDSIGSVFARGGIWVLISVVIIASMDQFNKDDDPSVSLKKNLGFFLMFLLVGGGLIYFLFGFAPFVTTTQAVGTEIQ